LQRRYRGKRELIVPKAPEWHIGEEDEEGSDDEENSGDEDADPSKKRKLEVVIPPFEEPDSAEPATKRIKSAGDGVEAISGLQPLAPQSPLYERALSVMRQLTVTGSDTAKCLPLYADTPLTPQHLETNELTHRYSLSWRAKGRRGLLLLLNEGVFFLESSATNTNTIQISKCRNMHFPKNKDPKNAPSHRTLLDGILVQDQETPQKLIPRYLISDVLCHEGAILFRRPYSQRLSHATQLIMARKKAQAQPTNSHDFNTECFKVRVKDQFDLSKTEFLIRSFMKKITHGTDGIVLVPKDAPYGFRADNTSADSEEWSGKRVLTWSPNSQVVDASVLISKTKQIMSRIK